MRRIGALVVLLALLAGCGTTRAAAAGTDVATRTLLLSRGLDRPLPTTVWFPAELAGRHPIVLFSHGLGGLPGHFAPLLSTLAAAGYVVAAPTYPRTNARVRVDRSDIRRQSDDAAHVLERLKALDSVAGDPFAGHLDTGRVAAVGFSAGGTTTLGLFGRGHDRSLRAAISVAGRRPAVPFGGPAAPILFLHGDRDRVVPIEAGEKAYAAVPWPGKRFVTMPGEAHGQYLNPTDDSYPRASSAILAFLHEWVPAR